MPDQRTAVVFGVADLADAIGMVIPRLAAWAALGLIADIAPASIAALVLEALSALQPRSKKQRQEVRKAIDYFAANAGRMDCPPYAATAGQSARAWSSLPAGWSRT